MSKKRKQNKNLAEIKAYLIEKHGMSDCAAECASQELFAYADLLRELNFTVADVEFNDNFSRMRLHCVPLDAPVLISRKAGNLSVIERYDFRSAIYQSDAPGLRICYAVASAGFIPLTRLEITEECEEVGVAGRRRCFTRREEFAAAFPTLKAFLKVYNNGRFGLWTATVNLRGVEVVISGDRDTPEVGVSYPKGAKPGVLGTLKRIKFHG